MIDFYYAPTPNGQKVRIFMEETGLPHRVVRVSLGKGEQFKPEFLAISPNNKIPAIVDQAPRDDGEPLPIFESGAVLLYLAEKVGRFIPGDPRSKLAMMQWLFWQVGGLGPMAGQAGHFRKHAPEPVPYAIDRYTRELTRLFGVMDRRLGKVEHLAGDYSIADMAAYPWIVPHDGLGQVLDDFPHLARWFRSVATRPAVIRAYEGVKDVYARDQAALSESERRVLFTGNADGEKS